MHRADRKAGKRVWYRAHAIAVGKAPDAKIELNVGSFEPRIAARETAGADAVAGQWSFLEEHVLHAGQQLLHRAIGDVIQGDRLRAAEGQPDIEMVLEIGANRRHVPHNRDAVLLQHLGRAESRQLQELRRRKHRRKR